MEKKRGAIFASGSPASLKLRAETKSRIMREYGKEETTQDKQGATEDSDRHGCGAEGTSGDACLRCAA